MYIWCLHWEGEGGPQISRWLISCVTVTVKRGEGVKISENFAVKNSPRLWLCDTSHKCSSCSKERRRLLVSWWCLLMVSKRVNENHCTKYCGWPIKTDHWWIIKRVKTGRDESQGKVVISTFGFLSLTWCYWGLSISLFANQRWSIL